MALRAPTARPARSPRLYAASLAFWTIFGVLFAAQIYVRESGEKWGVTARDVFGIVYFYWAWALLTPLILRLAAALLASDRPWWRRIVEHLPAAVAVIVVQSALYALFSAIDGEFAYAAIPYATGRNLMRHLAGNVLTYATIVAAYAAYHQTRRSRDRERETARLALRASELETLLARTRLEALEAQLQPHFLFNTLNIISTLVVRGDAAAADRALARLGDLLRASLSSSAGQEVTLAEELALARRYLEIAQLRFGDRLTVTERVSDDALGARVPTLILQPLLENAITHAIAPRARGGRIEIAADREGDTLAISVRDDGPGFAGDPLAAAGRGVGLANVRARLALLHGDGAHLSTANAPDGGALVTMHIPSTAAAARSWDSAAPSQAAAPRVGGIARVALTCIALAAATPVASGRASAQQAPRTLAVVLAHADDEAPVAPILARYAREGVQVYMIIASDGVAGTGQQGYIPRPDAGPQGEELVRQRAEEARCAAQALGIRPPILLSFPDGKLGDYVGDRTLIYRLTQRIAEELARLRPDAVLTWGPDGGFGHPDHRMVSNVVTQLQRAGAPGVPERVFYMYLPVESIRAMNPKRGEPPLVIPQAKYFTVRVPFAPEDLQAAERSMVCHRSQFTAEVVQRVVPATARAWNGKISLVPAFQTAPATDVFR